MVPFSFYFQKVIADGFISFHLIINNFYYWIQSTGSAADTTRDTSYQAKDTVQSKAADVNNATDDSETYTQKTANTAYDVKDKAANALGLTQPSTGPSLLDKAKGYLGGAADTTKDYAGSAADNTREGLNQPSGGSLTDTIKGYTGSAVDTTKDNAQRATDATNDYAGSAAENTRQGLNQPSTGPSMLDKAKGYLGVAADTTKDSTGKQRLQKSKAVWTFIGAVKTVCVIC